MLLGLVEPSEQWPIQPAAAGPATAASIAENFASWFVKAGPHDLIFFSYSGHGTFLHFTGDGAEVHEEALLGSDYATTDPPQVLTFSQLRWLHSRLHDGQSVFVIDACHSGGGTLALNALISPFGAPPPTRYSAAAPDTRPVTTPALAEAGLAPAVSAADLEKTRRRSVTVTACQSWELASAAGPELRLLDKVQQTGVLTGDLVKAMAAGAENQSWEDIARTARFLSVLRCIGQTVGVSGGGLASMPFTQPATTPTAPPYYMAAPRDGKLVMPADSFLGLGSLLAVYKDATPVGAALDPQARLESLAVPVADLAQLAGTVPAEGRRAAVARRQHLVLPPVGVFAQAADALGLDQPESKGLREQLGSVPYVHMCQSASDPAVDYRLWVSIEDENTTRPFARAKSAEFPSSQAQRHPTPRPFQDSATWLTGMLHYARAVQGAAWARNYGSGFRLSVIPDKGRPLYLPGAPVKLRLEASAACHVVVVVADSAGNTLAMPPQAVSPGKSAEVEFTPPAGGAAHDMRLAVVKAFAFRQRPEDSAVTKMIADAKSDPAAAMFGLLRTALGGASADSIPTDGWADNDTFVTVWDRTPLSGPVEF